MSFFSNRRQSEPDLPVPDHQRRMSSISPSQHPIGFETVLGANAIMEGTLESHANIRLDGEFTGTLKITGNVLVGENAKINADVHAKNVSIAGAVRGNVSGNKVQILRTGQVWGDITATALATEEGAFIDGKISMTTPQTDPQPESVEEVSNTEEVGTGEPGDTAIFSRQEFDEAMQDLEADQQNDAQDRAQEGDTTKND